MSCVLSITGSEFNVDDFIAEAGWLNILGDKLRVYRTGEFINSLKRRKYRDNGFSIIVSDVGFDDLEGQQKEVLAFIKEHCDQLALLKSTK